eukprot:3201770-Pleurochrysis_carterae.AAC.1
MRVGAAAVEESRQVAIATAGEAVVRGLGREQTSVRVSVACACASAIHIGHGCPRTLDSRH